MPFQDKEAWNIAVDLMPVYTSIGDQTDSIWNFFITIHLAIIALGLVQRVKIDSIQLGLAVIGYGIFSFMNARALMNNYSLLSESTIDIKNLGLSDSRLMSAIAAESYDDRIFIVITSHIIGLLIFCIVFFKGHYEYRTTNGRAL